MVGTPNGSTESVSEGLGHVIANYSLPCPQWELSAEAPSVPPR